MIADNGPGIPEIFEDRIFNKFYQVSGDGFKSKPGFGIGLSLVMNVAESHGGSIHYEPAPEQGARFILALPQGDVSAEPEIIVQEDSKIILPEEQSELADKETKTPQRLDPLVSTGATLLVIDDNDQLRQYIAGIFADIYKVYEAKSGELGLQIAHEQLPDLVISDIVMEGMSGIDVCSAIKDDPALGHIPVILLTGSSSPEKRLTGIQHGADDYITKPFEKELLIARVSSLLKSRNVLQNYFYNEITLQKNTLKVSKEYKTFLERCIIVVEQHIDDEDFSIKVLARELGMSHSNLYRKVKSISGQSINAFIRFIRLRKAAELFINTNHNVNETAFQVGINDVKYFREQFFRLFGLKPSEYIKKYRKAFSSSYRINKEAFNNEAPENSAEHKAPPS